MTTLEDRKKHIYIMNMYEDLHVNKFFFTPLFCSCFWIRDPRSGMGKNQDPRCYIPDTDFNPSLPDPGSRIPDPKTALKERGEKKGTYVF
jgi:hypothetical protein